MTLSRYARQIAELDITASGKEPVSGAGQQLLIASILESRTEPPEDRTYLVPTVARSIETLRHAGLSPDAVRAHLVDRGPGGPRDELPEVYEAYVRFLENEGLYDEADVFRWATDRVQKNPPHDLSSTVFGIAEEIELTGRSVRLLDALSSRAHEAFLLGNGAEGAPEATAAALVSEKILYVPTAAEAEGESSGKASQTASSCGLPVGPEQAAGPADLRFREAVGARAEVRSVCRSVLKEEVPLDEISIAYTRSTPYLGLLVDTAQNMGIPLTMSPGLPVTTTRPGQALRGFYEWVLEDFDVAVLIRLLRAGLLKVEDWVERRDPDQDLDATDVARILAMRQYEPGREGYEKAFSAAIEDLGKEIEQMEKRGADPARQQKEREALRLTRRWVQELIGLVPRRTEASEMAEKSGAFLERFFRPYHAPGRETSRDDAALKVLHDSFLTERRDLPFSYADSTRRLAALFKDDLDQTYVGAARPKPGAVHILPLDGAGYNGRSHLYVVGLDSETTSQGAVRRRLLSEAEREVLRETSELRLPEPAAEGDSMWFLRQALRRHTGTCTLVAKKYDLEEEEPRFPSSIYLQQASRRNEGGDLKDLAHDTEYLSPRSAPEVALDTADVWLSAGHESGGRALQDVIDEAFPWLKEGHRAETRRASSRYTEYDGLLPDGSYPELDILGPDQEAPVSAHRLEALAEAPYTYFLKYVLGAQPREEPALDDEPWLNDRRRGSILHDTFERFMREIDRPPAEEDEDRLLEILRARFDRESRRIAPETSFVEQSARRTLRADARLFLAAEARRDGDSTPHAYEFGFGYGPGHPRYVKGDAELGIMTLQGGDSLWARGRIDRVDRHPDGSFSIWDYKTGSSKRFDVGDPLQEGETLQWALYAAVYEELTGEQVRKSGYFFTSTREMGYRLGFRPRTHRQELEEVLRRLSDLARSGSFPMRPGADRTTAWKWEDFDAIVPDLDGRTDQLGEKQYPDGRPRPHFLE